MTPRKSGPRTSNNTPMAPLDAQLPMPLVCDVFVHGLVGIGIAQCAMSVSQLAATAVKAEATNCKE